LAVHSIPEAFAKEGDRKIKEFCGGVVKYWRDDA
jgi:hypothetical protein